MGVNLLYSPSISSSKRFTCAESSACDALHAKPCGDNEAMRWVSTIWQKTGTRIVDLNQ